MAKGKFNQKKSALKSLWKKAKKQVEENPDPFGFQVEDGKYVAQLMGGVIKTSNTDRAWKYLEWDWEITEGDSEGTHIFRRTGLESEENLSYLIHDFVRLGVEIEALEINSEEDLIKVMEELAASSTSARLTVKKGDGDFQNIYIDKFLGSEENKTETAGSEDDDADFTGKTMGYKKGQKMYVGEITAHYDDGTFDMALENGKEISGKVSDLEEPEKASDSEEPENEDSDSSAGEEELEVGTRVTTKIDGETYAGGIIKIEDDFATIEFDDGDVLTLSVSDISLEED